MTELELESYDNLCYWDYVTLYDGQTERSLVLYTYCIPDTTVITSTGSSLLVVFRTDVSANYGRFSFSWTFVFNGEGAFIIAFIYAVGPMVKFATSAVAFSTSASKIRNAGLHAVIELCGSLKYIGLIV